MLWFVATSSDGKPHYCAELLGAQTWHHFGETELQLLSSDCQRWLSPDEATLYPELDAAFFVDLI